jgi:hypothetical protein
LTYVRIRIVITLAVGVVIAAIASTAGGTLLASPAWKGTDTVAPRVATAEAAAFGEVGATSPTGATGPTGSAGPIGAPKPPCQRMRLHLRCPDLVMSAPSKFHLDRTTIPGRVLLRTTSSIDNHGQGPLEVRGRRTRAHRWVVYQAIYDRKGRAHLFKTGAKLVYKYVPGRRYGYGTVGAFSYWKFEHAAAFELWSIDRHRKAVRLLRTGPKVDYCLRDLFRTFPSRSSPSSPVYPACNQDPHIKRDVLGTSVGWTDSYPYEYPEQWIDVTGLHGRFVYLQIADPDKLLFESKHRNNISETYVALPSGRVLGHRVEVGSP